MTQSEIAAASSHNTDDLLKQPQPFPNLRAGGRELCALLESFRGRSDLLVLGIALGGLPVAHEVATHLEAPLDFVIIKRLFMPDGYGSQICAVSAAGSLIIDDGIKPVDEPSTPFEYFVNEAITELSRRERTCRRQRPPIPLAGKEVILVDCGIRTGSTMKAALVALRRAGPKKIVGAVPVSSREGYAVISSLCDELICLAQPESFVNAGYWYRDFSRAADDEAGEMLD